MVTNARGPLSQLTDDEKRAVREGALLRFLRLHRGFAASNPAASDLRPQLSGYSGGKPSQSRKRTAKQQEGREQQQRPSRPRRGGGASE